MNIEIFYGAFIDRHTDRHTRNHIYWRTEVKSTHQIGQPDVKADNYTDHD